MASLAALGNMPLVRDWELCRSLNCRERLEAPGFQDPLFLRLWLGQFKGDATGMFAMRTFLWRGGRVLDLFRLSDDDVIAQLADLLASGCVHVHTQPRRAARAGGGSSGTSATQTPVPFPMSQQPKPPPQERQPEAADPATFPINLDGPAQVAALMSAAAQGVPFCPE